MIEINLLPEELKVRGKSQKRGIKIEPKTSLYLIPFILGLLVCVHLYLSLVTVSINVQLKVLNARWQKLEPQRRQLESLDKELTSTSGDTKTIKELAAGKMSWSEKLNSLSADLPAGIWFNELSISSSNFTLKGSVISLEKDEMGLLKRFIDSLKAENDFFKDFKSLELASVEKRSVGGYEIADFILLGTLK
jgi:Tfp pilus assembly protein PilN